MARRPERQEQIFLTLQQQIISGELPPGSKLSTRVEVERRFKASPLTVQRVFDRLQADGYTENRGRRGSFVVVHPPHLFHYWLVFPPENDPGAHTARNALVAEAERLSWRGPERVMLYAPVSSPREDRHGARIFYDVGTRRTAGLIFATNVGYWSGTPLLHLPGVPRVALVHGEGRPPGVSCVRLDRHSLVERALEHFRGLGRRRLGVLSIWTKPGMRAHDEIIETAARHGLEIRPHWVQYAHPHAPLTAEHVIDLLLRLPADDRPDSLLILDDNLVEPASLGILKAGIRVPDELELVGHANFPWPTSAQVPMRRIGFNIREVLESCVNLLGRTRLAPALMMDESIHAVFAEELDFQQEVSSLA